LGIPTATAVLHFMHPIMTKDDEPHRPGCIWSQTSTSRCGAVERISQAGLADSGVCLCSALAPSPRRLPIAPPIATTPGNLSGDCTGDGTPSSDDANLVLTKVAG
jgi:hypothetical protein